MKDTEIIEGLKANSNTTAKLFLEKYSPIIRGIAYRSGVKEDADQDELLQITIVEFIKKCKSGLVLTCKLETYLYSFVKNLSLRHIINDKYKKRAVELESKHDKGYMNFKDDMNDKTYSTVMRINKVINNLPERKQRFMKLLIAGYSTEELMNELDLKNKDVVKTFKYKTIQTIKKELKY